MGHFRLGQLPRTARWKQVIALLQRGASVEELANASFKAAQTGLSRVPNDPGFTQTLTTVFQFIDALQSGNPISSLRRQGFDIKAGASLFDFVGSFKERATEAANSARARSDIAEMARDSFAQVLMRSAGSSLQTLFGVESKDAQKTLQSSLKGKPLGSTMHEFFSTFTQRYLNYYLGRAVPSFVGSGKTFANTESHTEFRRMRLPQRLAVTADAVNSQI